MRAAALRHAAACSPLPGRLAQQAHLPLVLCLGLVIFRQLIVQVIARAVIQAVPAGPLFLDGGQHVAQLGILLPRVVRILGALQGCSI